MEAFHETTDEAAFELTQPMKSAGREAPKAPVARICGELGWYREQCLVPMQGWGFFIFFRTAICGEGSQPREYRAQRLPLRERIINGGLTHEKHWIERTA